MTLCPRLAKALGKAPATSPSPPKNNNQLVSSYIAQAEGPCLMQIQMYVKDLLEEEINYKFIYWHFIAYHTT